MEILQSLSYCSYVRVRYEDLVRKGKTEKILKELYEFMGIPVNFKSGNSNMGYLLHGKSHSSPVDYYGLDRDKDFDPNHWTGQLSKKV